jgi:similar to stage IV sporulation protein
MNFWRSLSGMVEVRITSADPAGFLRVINGSGIEVFNVYAEGDLSLHFFIRRADYRRLRRLTRKRGELLELLARDGLYWAIRRLTARPVLLAGLALLPFLTVYLPGQIYFVEVEGNTRIPSAQIIEKAADCGIAFGADRREVRSEKMKNTLLQAMPQLQWAGINTFGCRAVISVKERPVEEPKNLKTGVSSIVADRDGIVKAITVQSGNRLCVPGQAVKAGQVLISGYTDCGICIRATRAKGEIFAETKRQLTVVLPLQYTQKGQTHAQEKKYSLLIGKKLINFSKGSGISTSGCDKMYSVDYITLPGNLRLPVALVTETVVSYDTSQNSIDKETAQGLLTSFSTGYLSDTMIAGQIIQRFETVQWFDAVCVLYGRYACVEMIGKTRLEENLNDYGQAH